MKLYITPPGGARTDVSALYRSVIWSGSYRQCARQLKIETVYTDHDQHIPKINAPLGSVAEMEQDGELLFYGTVVTAQRTGGQSILTLACLDNGQYMRNEGWYSFKNSTPEAATRAVARDFGIEVGEIAQTGVAVSRKFPGVALYQIIATMYTKAGEKNGRRYMVGFRGKKLCVWEKPEDGDGLIIAPRSNLMYASVANDISKLYDRVAIYSETGTRLRVIDNEAAVKAYGVFQHIITQRSGEDSAAAARAYLADNDVKQTINVDCIGDVRQVAGRTVLLRDNSIGVTGRFWIDGDTHTWKNGQHFTKLELNFRNLMDEVSAGKEK